MVRRVWVYERACENPVGLSCICDGPIGRCLIECCHKTAEIHFLCIQFIN